MKTSMAEGSEPSSAVEKRIRKSISFKPNMPMLSRQGFIDLMNIEYHKDIDQAHEYLKRAIKAYGIWKELGEMPRDILPDQSMSTALNTVKFKPARSKFVESKSIESDSAEMKFVEPKSVAEETIAAEEEIKEEGMAIHEPDEGPELLLSAMLVQPRGGEAKIEALMKKEEFDQREASEPKPNPETEPWSYSNVEERPSPEIKLME